MEINEKTEDIKETKVEDLTPVRQDVKGNIDLEATLNKIRAEEKRKHQNDIDKYKKEAEEKEKSLSELKMQLQSFQDANKSDVEKALTQINDLSTKYAEADNVIKELKAQNQLKELEIYKVKKLMSSGSELIPELVTGSTPEEIDLSIEIAKAKYNEIVSRVVKQQQQQVQQISAVIPPSNPGSVAKQDKIGITELDVSSMSLEEYKKNRDQIRNMAIKQTVKSF